MSNEVARGADFSADAEQLRQSMQAGPNPDVAKGVLMVLYGCDGNAAFADLLDVAERAQVRLTDLAAALVYLVNDNAAGGDGGGKLDDDPDWNFADLNPLAVAAAEQAWGPALRRVKATTNVGPLYALPRGAHRLAEAAEYLTELLTPRALVSLGLILRPQDGRQQDRESA